MVLQVLSNVLGVVPWVIDFIVDSGWAQEIVRYQELPLHDIEALAYLRNLNLRHLCRTLGKVKTTGIERGTLSAFEDFLCALIRGSFDVTDVLKDNGVISVCQVCVLSRTYEKSSYFSFQQHQLKDLSTAIAQSDVARRKKISTEKKDSNEKKTKN